MKKVVKASRYEDRRDTALNRIRNARKRERELIQLLSDEGVSEHTLLVHFFDYLDAETCVRVLEDLASECDIDLEEE